MSKRAEEFAASKDTFIAYLQDPRGRIFYETVQFQLSHHLPAAKSRVLDVGCGFSPLDLWLARAGHAVTGIDVTPDLLGVARTQAAEAGLSVEYLVFDLDEQDVSALGAPFDFVLCHNVLEYVQQVDHTLAQLAACTAPGGRLSLVSHNPTAKVLQAALFEHDPALALSKLDKHSTFISLIQAEVPLYSAAELTAKLHQLGFDLVAHYGVRTLYDYINTPKRTDPEYYQQSLALEIALSARSPYRDMAAFTHLVLQKRLP